MNCSEFEASLQQSVERRQSELADDCFVHLESCPSCHSRWHEHRLLEVALKAWIPVEVPLSLSGRVLEQLLTVDVVSKSSNGDVRRSDGRMIWPVVAAAAVCLLAMIGLGQMNLHSTNNSLVQNIRQNRPSAVIEIPGAGPSSAEVATSVAAVIADLRAEYRELAAETSATAHDFAAVIPPVMTAWTNDGLMPRYPNGSGSNQVDKSPPGAASKIGRSIGHHLGEAMDFLWLAVPEEVPRG